MMLGVRLERGGEICGGGEARELREEGMCASAWRERRMSKVRGFNVVVCFW